MFSIREKEYLFVDFDGTLVDSLPALYKGYLEFLEEFGVKGSLEEFEELNGVVLKEIVEVLSKRYKFTQPLEDLEEKCKFIMSKKYYQEIKPFSGAIETLLKWREAGGKVSLVTSSHALLIDPFLKKNNMAHLFDSVVTGDLVSRGKPAPDIFLHALNKASISAEKVLVIEDSNNGIRSALSAGIEVICFTGEEEKGEEKEIEGDKRDKERKEEEVVCFKDWSSIGKAFGL